MATAITERSQEMPALELSPKQIQFNAAMDRFHCMKRYKTFARFVSIINISLQLCLIYRVMPLPVGVSGHALSLLIAFIVTDFLNGLVHMFMDNNDSYESISGPLIANFHLHHKVMQYKKHNLLIVYFNETGSKVWLVAYLAAVSLLAGASWVGPISLHILLYIGILSSVAEVSHYLCHTSTSRISMSLGNCGILLSKRHHARHHLRDNANYGFLNGLTDPLLNLIASAWYPGYKQTTDTHYAHYVMPNIQRR